MGEVQIQILCFSWDSSWKVIISAIITIRPKFLSIIQPWSLLNSKDVLSDMVKWILMKIVVQEQ